MSAALGAQPTPTPTARLAARMHGLAPSAVREILKVAERPEVISFAGGLPAPELFPVGPIAEAFQEVLSQEGAAALQYGVTEGYGPLREWIAARLGAQGTESSVERLMITTGSQQGIDLVAKLFLDPGDAVAVEAPTYLAALQAFSAYQAVPAEVPSDDEGMDTGALEEVLAGGRVKLIYVVPDFQNPKGTTMSEARRRRLVALARRHSAIILEDDPYGELRFRGRRPPALSALDGGNVIRLGTFSKTLAPGLRVGWVLAPPEIARRLAIAKQAADLHTATLVQRATARLLERFDYEGHLATLRRSYGARCEAMLEALERWMPAGARWTRPAGGLFLWLQLPDGVRDEALFQGAMERNVAVVPGRAFFATPGQDRHVRLNYSNQRPERIEDGIRRLGAAVEEQLAAGQAPLPAR